MTGKLIPFQEPKPDSDAHAQAETERKKKLFAWADALLHRIGLSVKVAQAQDVSALRKVTIDTDDPEIELAIRDALHPIAEKRAEHFIGMREGMLKRILKARFNEMKKNREAKLLGHTGTAAGGRAASYNWTNDLKLDDKGGIRPIITNLILFLRHHPTWKDVLAFDAFNLRVVFRKRPYWGDEQPDLPLVDHHETLIRMWFETEDIIGSQTNIGRAIQAAARFNRFHPLRDYLNPLTWDGTSRIGTWLTVYLGASDNPYTRAIGPRFLISGVARILTSGCKVDTMPILEGPQGRRKSMALRKLFEPWYTDRLSAFATKDAAMEMAGVLGGRGCRDGGHQQGRDGHEQGVHLAPVRPLPSALWQALGRSAPPKHPGRHHQSTCRRLLEGLDRSTTDVAVRMRRDRRRGVGTRSRSVVGRSRPEPEEAEPLGGNARCCNSQAQAGLLQASGAQKGQAGPQLGILAAVIFLKKRLGLLGPPREARP